MSTLIPNNNTTNYGYSGFGEQTQIQSPDTGTATFVHNNAGLVIHKTDSRGKITMYTYDVLGRVTTMSLNDGSQSYTYDVGTNGVGRLATVSGYGSTTHFTYDTYGRVTSKSVTITGAPSAFVTATTYDTMGRTSSISYPSGNVLGMSYSEGRIVNMTLTPSGGSSTPLISDIRYFPFGGPESWLLGPNQASSMAYLREIDLNSRIEKYSTPTGYRQLGFGDGGRITSMKNCSTTTVPCPAANLLWTNTFGYDTVGRLTSFNGSTSNGNAAANITQSQSFTYDANGNRLTAILNGTTSTYAYPGGATPTSNRLTSVTGGLVMTNTYDNAGNLTSDGARTFAYDSRGRMTSATNAGTTTSYLIDSRNLRVKKSNSTETKYFVYDESGHMLGEYDGNGNAVQELFWLGDTPIAVRGNMPCLTGGTCTEAATAYVWADHLNTPRELTRVNPSNNQHISMWKWDSLPFGETSPNQNPSNIGVMNFNHRFPGQYRDSETGLYQNWFREYDARIGRYVTSDPLGLAGGINTYAYSRSSPIILFDFNGLTPLSQCEKVVLSEFFGQELLNAAQVFLDPGMTGNTQAMTIGQNIFFGPGHYNASSAAGIGLLAHELLHSQQARTMGLGAFLARYGSEFLRNLFAGMTAHQAYENISFEVQARDLQALVVKAMNDKFKGGTICQTQCIGVMPNPNNGGG